MAGDTRPDSTASRTAGTASITRAVLTWLWASRRDSPAASASTWAPPSPWRSASAMRRAAPAWNAEPAAMNALQTASASRISAHDTEPSLTYPSISVAATSARRALSINMHKIFQNSQAVDVELAQHRDQYAHRGKQQAIDGTQSIQASPISRRLGVPSTVLHSGSGRPRW